MRTHRRKLHDQEVIRAILRYVPETGKLFWRNRPPKMFATKRAHATWNTQNAGREALTGVGTHGYRYGSLLGVRFLAHRVIWKYVHGIDPDYIDHINGDKTDNRIANLRSCSMQENMRNTRLRNDNKSGHVGVHFDSSRGKWVAQIHVAPRAISLGRFDSFNLAVEARKRAEALWGFSARHGEKPIPASSADLATLKGEQAALQEAYAARGCAGGALAQAGDLS